MSRIITESFDYFISELYPFDCFYSNFVYKNLVHGII